jgi:hypothetical protein
LAGFKNDVAPSYAHSLDLHIDFFLIFATDLRNIGITYSSSYTDKIGGPKPTDMEVPASAMSIIIVAAMIKHTHNNSRRLVIMAVVVVAVGRAL